MTKKPDYANVFQTIKVDETTRKVFFSKLSRAENPFDWFDELEKRGYFDPKHMPVPSTNNEGDTIFEQWEVLGFLINCTLKNKILNEKGYWERIVQITDEAINHITDNHLENYKTDFAMVELIFNLPFSKIKCDWTAYIDYSMNTKGDSTLLSYKLTQGLEKILLSENQNAKTFLSKMTMLLLQPSQRNDDDNYSSHCSRMESYALEQFFQKYAEQLSEVLKEEGVEICETLINEIINSDPTTFSVYLIPQITLTYSTNHYFELEQLLVSFWSQCLLISPTNLVRDKLKLYLKSGHQIFQRVAVFIIGKRFDEFGELFFNAGENPLDNYSIKYETFELLKLNSSLLRESHIQRMVEWIGNQNFEYLKGSDLDATELDKYKINISKEWLFALTETDDPEIAKLSDKYYEIDQTIPTNPGYTFWMDKDPSVFTNRDDLNLKALNISEILEKSNTIIDSGEIHERFNELDFSFLIREDVSANPEKYLNDLKVLIGLNPNFQYSLLIGLYGVAQNRDDFPWNEALNYIDILLCKLDKESVSKNEFRNFESVLSASLNMVELLLNSRNVSAELFHSVNDILSRFLQPNRRFSVLEINDHIISMYNSIDFKLFSVWFLWFLKAHHLNLFSEHVEKETVKTEIEEYFENCANPDAFVFSFGRFLPFFFSKEPEFVKNLIVKINCQSNARWIKFMEGYLYFGNELYSGTYTLLKTNGLYIKALDQLFSDDTVENRKIAHICLVFLEGREPLICDDSLMKYILDSNKSRYFEEVIKFVGRKQNLYLVEEHFDDFRELFLSLIQKVESYEDDELKKKHFGLLGGWIILFHSLDNETFVKFKTIARYLHFQHKTTTFLNHLITIATSNPQETAELLKIALQSDSRHSFYDAVKMIALIDVLKISLKSDILIPICNIFITKGYIQFSNKVQELNGMSGEAN